MTRILNNYYVIYNQGKKQWPGIAYCIHIVFQCRYSATRNKMFHRHFQIHYYCVDDMRSKSLYACIIMNYGDETVFWKQVIQSHCTPNTKYNSPQFISHINIKRVHIILLSPIEIPSDFPKNRFLLMGNVSDNCINVDDRFLPYPEQSAHRRLTVTGSKRDFTCICSYSFFYACTYQNCSNFALFWWLQKIHNADKIVIL